MPMSTYWKVLSLFSIFQVRLRCSLIYRFSCQCSDCTTALKSTYVSFTIFKYTVYVLQQSIWTPFLEHQSFWNHWSLLIDVITSSGESSFTLRTCELTKSTINCTTEYIARIMDRLWTDSAPIMDRTVHRLWTGQCTDYGPDSAPIMDRTVHRFIDRTVQRLPAYCLFAMTETTLIVKLYLNVHKRLFLTTGVFVIL
jgi:hypothetical protein